MTCGKLCLMPMRDIVSYPLAEGFDEAEWLQAAARNPAFEDLKAPKEDIYSLEEGEPFRDQA